MVIYQRIISYYLCLYLCINSVAPDLESTQHYISGITISFILDNILYLSKTPSLYQEPYMATPIPLSGANCHVYISHHGRVVMLLKKMWLHNHKWCGLGFYSSCCILFLTLKKSQVIKSTSTWSPPGVHLESTRSPLGVHLESTRSPPGVHLESRRSPHGLTWSPQGVHTDSTRSWHGVLKESTRTYPEFTRTPGGPVGECKLQEK